MPILEAADPHAPVEARLPPPVEVSDGERARLLDIARYAVAAAACGVPELGLAGQSLPADASRRDEERCGPAFVTLRVGGDLRGCIGTLDTDLPWSQSVARAAVSAALHDPRFAPLSEIELAAIEVEVSLLSPFVTLDDPLAFRLGVDGLLITRGFARGLLLPDVAPMFGLDRDGMLAASCRKAGLPGDAWRDPATVVQAFRTAHFGGPVLRGIEERA